MITEKIHVYFVPGLAAGKEIFRNITLPKQRFELHVIDWLIPEKKEGLSAYAKRMAAFVTEPNSVLIGVSFGGVMVQEMAVFLDLKKLIIVSSVKQRKELPTRMKVVKKTLAYKLAPTSLVLSATDLTKFAIGPKTQKRLRLYQEYLHVRDKQYLDWAIENMVCWERDAVDPDVIHIHGDSDVVFPIKNIDNPIKIVGGTHIMVLNKGAVISKKIVEIIENK